jgi:hypothetical protein
VLGAGVGSFCGFVDQGDAESFDAQMVSLSHSPHSASLIAHTRTRRDYYLYPDCLSIHRDIQD